MIEVHGEPWYGHHQVCVFSDSECKDCHLFIKFNPGGFGNDDSLFCAKHDGWIQPQADCEYKVEE